MHSLFAFQGMHDFQFPAHGSSTFKAIPVREDPAVITTTVVVVNKSSDLSAFFS